MDIVDPWERTTGARRVQIAYDSRQVAVQCPAPTERCLILATYFLPMGSKLNFCPPKVASYIKPPLA